MDLVPELEACQDSRDCRCGVPMGLSPYDCTPQALGCQIELMWKSSRKGKQLNGMN